MTTDIYETVVQVEHDHTALEVMLEDLAMIALQGFAATDETLLEDARATWERLHEGITGHFGLEEMAFFTRLEERHPELDARLSAFRIQHQTMKAMLADLGGMLHGPLEQVMTRQSSFKPRWDELWLLWREHSRNEWELISELRGRLRANAFETPGQAAPP